MNLTAARAFARAKEVGIRKVNGASRGDLVKLFLSETLGLFGIANATLDGFSCKPPCLWSAAWSDGT